MNNLLRLFIVSCLAAIAIIFFALGQARHTIDLMAPFNLAVFALGLVVYLLPVFLALYRNCHATAWIAFVDVLFGWTILGWFVALGWAASGKVDTLPPTVTTPPGSPITGH